MNFDLYAVAQHVGLGLQGDGDAGDELETAGVKPGGSSVEGGTERCSLSNPCLISNVSPLIA